MRKKTRNSIIVAAIAVIIIALVCGCDYYRTFYRDNVSPQDEGAVVVKVYHNFSYDDLCRVMEESGALQSIRTFRRAARFMDLTDGFKAGAYSIRRGMNNKALVRMFANGWQTPVKVSFSGYIRSLERFSAILGEKFEADSASFATVLTDTAVMSKYGFEKESFIGMFIPNTYEFYWTVSPEAFVERMNKEYLAFWNESRQKKADDIGLDRKQVSTLASIVISETKYEPEMARVAGVYMNRLHKGILLQADPTVIFACNQFGIQRVLNSHLKIDSPYNTYIHKGLPPGPITMSPIVAIDAVLNYERHNYIFFCARETFDGQHNFASTLSGHMANARAYHKALTALQKKKKSEAGEK
ncbi:MAG: endolytic transglycosylase MltG [Bacteroidales bacterium]|nr:endolytic transglycosylase MltG [Candidatus Cacconaster merdequi]